MRALPLPAGRDLPRLLNSGLSARPSHRRASSPALHAPLGVSSLNCRLPLPGVGGLFGGLGSSACQGADPLQVQSAAFQSSCEVALPGAALDAEVA